MSNKTFTIVKLINIPLRFRPRDHVNCKIKKIRLSSDFSTAMFLPEKKKNWSYRFEIFKKEHASQGFYFQQK